MSLMFIPPLLCHSPAVIYCHTGSLILYLQLCICSFIRSNLAHWDVTAVLEVHAEDKDGDTFVTLHLLRASWGRLGYGLVPRPRIIFHKDHKSHSYFSGVHSYQQQK